MPKSVRVRVPAKINLCLALGEVRADGYHEIATVYQALSLFDHVAATAGKPGAGIRLLLAGEGVEHVPTDERNLAWRAAALAGQRFGHTADVDIRIDKRIPVAGGMAGGSADAAGALLACATLWGAAADRETLRGLAGQLGSDVPFSLVGGTAVGTGRGEVLAGAMSSGEFHWVLAMAHGGLATPTVYRVADEMRQGPAHRPEVSQDVMRALRSGDAAGLGRSLSNDLQPAAVSLLPQLELLLEVGLEHGALGAVVSGSGPTCGFLVSDDADALELAVALSSSGLCRGVRRASGPVPGATVLESG